MIFVATGSKPITSQAILIFGIFGSAVTTNTFALKPGVRGTRGRIRMIEICNTQRERSGGGALQRDWKALVRSGERRIVDHRRDVQTSCPPSEWPCWRKSRPLIDATQQRTNLMKPLHTGLLFRR
jgi:hypothetical protein